MHAKRSSTLIALPTVAPMSSRSGTVLRTEVWAMEHAFPPLMDSLQWRVIRVSWSRFPLLDLMYRTSLLTTVSVTTTAPSIQANQLELRSRLLIRGAVLQRTSRQRLQL